MNRLNNYINLISMFGGNNAIKCKFLQDAIKHEGEPNSGTWLGYAEIDNSDPENVKFAADLVKEFTTLPDNKNQAAVESWLQTKYNSLCGSPQPPPPLQLPPHVNVNVKCKFLQDAIKHEGEPNSGTWLGYAEIDNSDPENVKFAADLVKEFTTLPDNKNQAAVESWLQAKYNSLCGSPAPPAPHPFEIRKEEKPFEIRKEEKPFEIRKECTYSVGQTVYVTGTVVLHKVWPPSFGSETVVPKFEHKNVLNEKATIIEVRVITPKEGANKVCYYTVKFDFGSFAAEIIDGQLSTQKGIDITHEYYDAGDQQYHSFKVTVYITKPKGDIYVGGGSVSRGETVKAVLDSFKQKCNTCIISSGKQYVKSLEGKDLYTSFAHLNLKYDTAEIFIVS